MKTQAAVLHTINKPLQIQRLIIPELKPGQVLVKIAYTGVCHSQLNEIHGLKGDDKFLPHTLGHEGSGIVECVGDGVKKVKPNDHVVISWIKGIGLDVGSTQYRGENGSIVNSGAVSTFLTLAVISENRLTKIPKKMPLREAALLGCAVPTGAGIVFNMTMIKKNSTVAIFGIGGIGLSALLGAKLKGAKMIIAIDIDDDKLRHAENLGASHTINAKNENPIMMIQKITNQKGVDYAIESAGVKESMENAYKSICTKNGLCVIAGNLPKGENISIDPFNLIEGKHILGSWGGKTQPDKDIPRYVELCLSGELEIKKLIGKTFHLKDINIALDHLKKGAMGRILIRLS